MVVPQDVLTPSGIVIRDLAEHTLDGRSFMTFGVPGRDAVRAWQLLRDRHPDTGLWPVITGSTPPDPAYAAPHGEEAEVELDAEAFLAAALDELLSYGVDELGPFARDLASARPHANVVRREPRIARFSDALVVPRDLLSRRLLSTVQIALVPAMTAVDAPTVLRFGGYNDCPSPQTHGAVLARWHARYGVEVACVTRDVIELHVPSPPHDPAEALVLATEQYAYCPDIVDQGVETVPNLAGVLLDNPAWYFWWD